MRRFIFFVRLQYKLHYGPLNNYVRIRATHRAETKSRVKTNVTQIARDFRVYNDRTPPYFRVTYDDSMPTVITVIPKMRTN